MLVLLLKMSLPLTNNDSIAIKIQHAKENTCDEYKMSCAICLVKDKHHDMFSDVKRCVRGTMRCKEHAGQCANCQQNVDSDAQLICSSCTQAGQGGIFNEILLKAPKVRPCLFSIFTHNHTLACGCPKCMHETAQFYAIRAIEEGYSSSLSSPTVSDDDTTAIRMSF